jgi:hypothetical protein
VDDPYFDTTDLAFAATDGADNFSGIQIAAPASASPGTHWVTAVGRAGQCSTQAEFLVHTDWAQFRRSSWHSGFDPFENVLDPASVSGLDLEWSAFSSDRGRPSERALPTRKGLASGPSAGVCGRKVAGGRKRDRLDGRCKRRALRLCRRSEPEAARPSPVADAFAGECRRQTRR